MNLLTIKPMLEQLYQRRMTREMAKIDPHVSQLAINPVVEGGCPVKMTQLVVTCVDDNFKQFNASDFDVKSIIAVGAVHLLKPVTMRNGDVQGFADNVDAIAKGIDEQLNSNNNVSVSPQE